MTIIEVAKRTTLNSSGYLIFLILVKNLPIFAVHRVYCDILKQSNRIISNCPICRKLIVKSKQTESDFCSEECRLVNKNEWTKVIRAKNAGSDVHRTYDIFYTTGNNLKRKLKKDEARLNKFDEYFKGMRKKALALKNSVTDDSPDTEYKKQIWQMTDEIQRYADNLSDEIRDKKYKIR